MVQDLDNSSILDKFIQYIYRIRVNTVVFTGAQCHILPKVI